MIHDYVCIACIFLGIGIARNIGTRAGSQGDRHRHRIDAARGRGRSVSI